MKQNITCLLVTFLLLQNCKAQFLMDMIDTSTISGKEMLSISKKSDHLRFTGYIQPQFQVAATKGAKSFEGGDFAARVSNRFLLRRSRIRVDYIHFEKDNKPGVQFVFQFDANERSFTVRDVWGRIFENKYKLFSFTTGLFARPFGYEVNLSSADRESPERGRMSQILMKGERDLGAMASFEVRKENHPLKYLKIDVGIFNGQGITAPGEFDNVKDIIGRVALKPKKISKKITISAGTSILYGGLENNTKYEYRTAKTSGINRTVIDSTESNIGKVNPRRYYGMDVQVKFKNKIGFTEIRGEYIFGRQVGTTLSSETPNSLLTGRDGYYNRRFNGAYFYLVQNIFSLKHQVILKYDWYDPNTKIARNDIGAPSSNFTVADIKFSTIGIGYVWYINTGLKAILYYAIPINEKTNLPGYTTDLKDNVFTSRLQFRF